MAREPNNPVSERLDKESKKTFFAIEHTSKTSPMDIDDFVTFLNSGIVEKYNLKWCQAFWRKKDMERMKHDHDN